MLDAEFTCKKCEKHYSIKRESAEDVVQAAIDAELLNPGTTASDVLSAGVRYTHYMQTHYTREGKASASKFETADI